MARDIFNRYKELARKAEQTLGTKESLEWFRKRIRKDSPIKSFGRISESLRSGRITPGKMVTYVYDPKTKDKLPYYDSFPLIIVLEIAPQGWYGVNLHYLPPSIRATLLYEIEYRKTPAYALSKALESNQWTKPALKRYLFSHLKSKPMIIPKDDWEVAIQLPFENFQKATNQKVWRSSKDSVR